MVGRGGAMCVEGCWGGCVCNICMSHIYSSIERCPAYIKWGKKIKVQKILCAI